MTTLLLKDADLLVTMDADRREIPGGGVFVRDGVIEAVGPSASLPTQADETLSLALPCPVSSTRTTTCTKA